MKTIYLSKNANGEVKEIATKLVNMLLAKGVK